ncbi:MAG: (4Fe-4S)-binding protein [Flavobacteriaceae bacterium]
MGKTELVKEYKSGELTVVWKPRKCIHSEICVKTLPQVYRPNEKPWIQAEKASKEELMRQIDKCPSAALTYYSENKSEEKQETMNEGTKVEVMANGPLLVHGQLEITAADGQKEVKERTTAFCRCGASANKPYCDGKHNKVGFEG